jgi:hypothetical protein
MPQTNPYTTGVIDPGADLTADEVEFGRAVEAFRRRNRRKQPACSELLAILQALGYRKTAAADAARLKELRIF